MSLHGFQFLENLSTAYWYSEVLFAAIELSLFDLIEQGNRDLPALSSASDCKPEHIHRLLKVLQSIGLIQQEKGCWRNLPAARRYLLSDSQDYMGNFLLYRKYIRNSWQNITEKISRDPCNKNIALKPEDDYETRNFHYVRAMDEISKQKAKEITVLFSGMDFPSPILDIGGGAGTLARTFLQNCSSGEAIVFDLPEVIQVARKLYPKPESWSRMQSMEGDFLTCKFSEDQRFGTIILSNFLHVYDPDTAKQLLRKAAGLLLPNGYLLIHDYFPDRTVHYPHKGLLYDINMMLNTHNGICHSTACIVTWLEELGAGQIRIHDLPSDTCVIPALLPGIDGADTELEDNEQPDTMINFFS